jgi:hypothetical protein
MGDCEIGNQSLKIKAIVRKVSPVNPNGATDVENELEHISYV